jgi:hypothetical protein
MFEIQSMDFLGEVLGNWAEHPRHEYFVSGLYGQIIKTMDQASFIARSAI